MTKEKRYRDVQVPPRRTRGLSLVSHMMAELSSIVLLLSLCSLCVVCHAAIFRILRLGVVAWSGASGGLFVVCRKAELCERELVDACRVNTFHRCRCTFRASPWVWDR